MNFLNINQVADKLNITKGAIQKRIDNSNIFCLSVQNGKTLKHYIPEKYMEYNPSQSKYNKCKKIAVNNLKGGVGKTTIATNIATLLSILGKKVLIVDMDPQAQATSMFLNTEDDNEPLGMKKLIDSYANREKVTKEQIEKCILSIEIDEKYKIDILPSNIDLSNSIEYLKAVNDTAMFKINTILKKIENNYEYIIIDTPANASMIMRMCLYASDSILAVVAPEKLAVESMIKLFQQIELAIDDIEEYKGTTLDIFGIVINQIKNRKLHDAHIKNIEEIAKTYEIDYIYEVFDNIKVAEAQDLKIPLPLYKKELDDNGKSLEGIINIVYDLLTEERE